MQYLMKIMKRDPFVTGVLVYLTTFVITFGKIYNQAATCVNGYTGIEYACHVADKVMAALFGSFFWPLYWSVQMWK